MSQARPRWGAVVLSVLLVWLVRDPRPRRSAGSLPEETGLGAS